jgi:hypothetical protein
MIDIVSANEGLDLGTFDTDTTKAANVLSVQEGALEYAPTLGIDLKYFLSADFSFQNASFKAYLVERLANNRINVSSVLEQIESLYSLLTFKLSAQDKTSGLIR